jgi:hypothetical protein
VCHNHKWVTVMVHCHIEFDRATAHLAVLYITLVSDRAVDQNFNSLATIRAMDSSCLKPVHLVIPTQAYTP